jgi:hypothetical protein
MIGIGVIPATLLAGAAAFWIGVPGLLVLVLCAIAIALGAFAVSRDARTFDLALGVTCTAVVKFALLARPELANLLHTRFAVLEFLDSDWVVGGVAAVSIPLSGYLGIYGPLQGRYRLSLFSGGAPKFIVAAATWVAVSGALYANFSGRNLLAITVGMIAIALFVLSFRLDSRAPTPA